FVGDAQPTRVYFAVRGGATNPSSDNWLFTKDLDDGTVPAWSAARDPTFSSLANTSVSFSEHATLFDDKWVRDQLTHELLAITPSTKEPVSGPGNPVVSVTADGVERKWTILSIALDAKQPTYRKSEILEADIVVALEGGDQGLKIGLINPVAMLRTNTTTLPLVLTETTSSNDLALRRLTFKLRLDLAAEVVGGAQIEFSIPSVREDANAIARIAIFED